MNPSTARYVSAAVSSEEFLELQTAEGVTLMACLAEDTRWLERQARLIKQDAQFGESFA